MCPSGNRRFRLMCSQPSGDRCSSRGEEGISKICLKTVWLRVDRLKVSPVALVKAKLGCKKLGLKQPLLDGVLDDLLLLLEGLLRLRGRFKALFIVVTEELNGLLDLPFQKHPFGLLVEFRVPARLALGSRFSIG